MQKGIVVISEKDAASKKIGEILLNNYSIKMVRVQEETIFINELPLDNVDYVIFASKHASEKHVPCLTVHATGNFSNNNDFGGRPAELSYCPASVMKTAFIELKKMSARVPRFSVSIEATHHGPTSINKPLFFIEVGSSEKEWRDETACGVIAEVINKVLKTRIKDYESVIGFGGGHYNNKLSEVQASSDLAVGHVCSRHNTRFLNEELIKQMINKTLPEPRSCLIEKGLKGKEKRLIINVLEKLNKEYSFI